MLFSICGPIIQISIMVDGTLHGYFSCSRGVRQGYLLSPILFGIAKDFLSHYFSSLVDSGFLMPMLSPRDGQSRTHLLYADYVLLFCQGTVQIIRVIVDVFFLCMACCLGSWLIGIN